MVYFIKEKLYSYMGYFIRESDWESEWVVEVGLRRIKDRFFFDFGNDYEVYSWLKEEIKGRSLEKSYFFLFISLLMSFWKVVCK